MEIEEVKRVLRELNQKDLQEPEIFYVICNDPFLKDKEVGEKVGYSRSTVYGRKREIFRFLAGRGIMKFPEKNQNIIPPEVCQAMNELVRELIPKDAPLGSRPQWDLWPPPEPEPDPEPEITPVPEQVVEPEAPPIEEAAAETEQIEEEEKEIEADEVPVEPVTINQQEGVVNPSPFRVVDHIPAPVPAPQPGRTRIRNWLTRNNIVMVVLALILLFGASLLIRQWNPFITVPEPTVETVAVLETEAVDSTVPSTTRTPNVTRTRQMEATLTAVYAAITATAFKTPIPTSVPTRTPAPTITPTATITPTITPTPTPSLNLPWVDTFESGELAPEWDVLQDTYALYHENDNWFVRPSQSSFEANEYTCAQFRIGDSTLSNFYIELNYGGRTGRDIGRIYNSLEMIFGGNFRVRFIYESTRVAFVWEQYGGGRWVEINVEDGFEFEDASHLRLEFYENKRFAALLDGSLWSEFTYPISDIITGPILIRLCNYAYMDNVRIDYLP